MRSRVHPLIADAIVGHGDRKKTVPHYMLIFNPDSTRNIVDMVHTVR